MSDNNNHQATDHQYNIYWFDDDPSRVSEELIYQIEHPNGEGSPRAKLTVVSLNHQDVPNKVASVLANPLSDLVIIDHVLNQANEHSIMKQGSSIAATIRGAWPGVPIVGVTAKFNTREEKFLRVLEHEYIELFDFASLSRDIPSLYAICEGYRKLWDRLDATKNAPENQLQDLIFDLLDCPSHTRDDLASILPSEFKEQANPALAHSLSRWIWHQLAERPGLLYDERYAAVLLGLNKAGFGKIADKFRSAKFTGIFASDARQRWWTSLLKSQLLSLVPEPKFAPIIERGRRLPDITPDDHSRAFYSDDPSPDTLAAADAADPELRPERIRYTEVHPKETLLVGFEPRRIFKAR